MTVNPVVSRSTLKRLPLYLHLLENLQAQGTETVSCTQIAREFDFDPTQVRKDLEATGEKGIPRVGFRVAGLTEKIREFLGWDTAHEAVLIGAGSLGRALLGYRDFERYGLKIVAAFDKAAGKAGGRIAGKEVFPMSKLPGFIRRARIHIGVVAVPAEHAQSVVDVLVAAGVRAVWNFAPAPLKIPDGILLENARLTQSLAVLTNNLTRAGIGLTAKGRVYDIR